MGHAGEARLSSSGTPPPARGTSAPRRRRPRLPATLHALRHRNYQYFWSGALVANIGSWMRTIALGWLVLDLTGSAWLLGVVSFAQTVPILLVSLPAGVVADRFSRRAVLVVTQAALLALTAVLSVLVAGRWVTIEHVLVLSLLMGLAFAFNGPAWQSFINDLVPRDDLPNAIALNSVQFNFSRIVGPAIAGVLIAAVGIAACFFINTATYMAVLLALALIRLPAAAGAAKRLPLWQGIAEGLAYLRDDPQRRAIMLVTAILTVFGFPYAVLMPIVARDALGQDATGYGQLMAATGIGAFAGALAVASLGRSAHRSRVLVLALAAFSSSLVVFAASRLFVVSLVALAVLGCSMVAYMTTANTALQTSVPEHLRGRVMSVWTLTAFGLTPLGSLQAGAVANVYGAPVALGAGAVICGLATIVFALTVPSRRRTAT